MTSETPVPLAEQIAVVRRIVKDATEGYIADLHEDEIAALTEAVATLEQHDALAAKAQRSAAEAGAIERAAQLCEARAAKHRRNKHVRCSLAVEIRALASPQGPEDTPKAVAAAIAERTGAEPDPRDRNVPQGTSRYSLVPSAMAERTAKESKS